MSVDPSQRPPLRRREQPITASGRPTDSPCELQVDGQMPRLPSRDQRGMPSLDATMTSVTGHESAKHDEAQAASCVVVRRHDGAVLMQLRDGLPWIAHPGVWSLPGGRIEPGEEPGAAARRELREEIGFDADCLTPIGVDFDDDGTGDRIYLFATEIGGAEALQLIVDEGQAIAWRSPRDWLAVPDLVPFARRAVLRVMGADGGQ